MSVLLILIGVLAVLAVIARYAPAARNGPPDRDDRDRDRQLVELRALPGYHADPRV